MLVLPQKSTKIQPDIIRHIGPSEASNQDKGRLAVPKSYYIHVTSSNAQFVNLICPPHQTNLGPAINIEIEISYQGRNWSQNSRKFEGEQNYIEYHNYKEQNFVKHLVERQRQFQQTLAFPDTQDFFDADIFELNLHLDKI